MRGTVFLQFHAGFIILCIIDLGLMCLYDGKSCFPDLGFQIFRFNDNQFAVLPQNSLYKYLLRGNRNFYQFEDWIVCIPNNLLVLMKWHREDRVVNVFVKTQSDILYRSKVKLDVIVYFRVWLKGIIKYFCFLNTMDHKTSGGRCIFGTGMDIPVIIPEKESMRLDRSFRNFPLVVTIDDL